jgi:glycosyltransferase involved in cell wall biosynthesis
MATDVQPAVSVIIPVFNGAGQIQGALESVFAQTSKDLEIIVVDDGSKDGTKALLDPWIKEGKIRYLYQENKGPAAARNTGMRQARGKYFKFLDADDLLYPEQLERQIKHLSGKFSSVISATGYDLEFENGHKIPLQLYLKEDQLAQFIGGNPCPIHSILVERSFAEQAGGFDEELQNNQDSDLWLRLLMKGAVIEKLGHIGCCYRIQGASITSKLDKMFDQRCKYYEKINTALMPQLKELREEVQRELYWANINLIEGCFARGIKPASVLSAALKAAAILYGIRAGTMDKFKLMITGIQAVALKQYQKTCRIDKNYPKKLQGTAWRDERFYMRKDFQYLEVEPINKKVKNVLYLNSSAVMYGAETRLLDIVQNLDRDKYRPFALIPHAGPLGERLRELQVIVMYLEYGFPLDTLNRSTIKPFLRLNRDFVRLVRYYDIDIIHANLHINMSKFWLAFLILRKPLIVHMRSHFWLSAFEKFVICRASKAVFVSKFVEREFFKKRRFNFLMFHQKDHSEVLHDGIDVNHFSPQAVKGGIRKELKVKQEDFLIGIIGAVDKVKGQDLLIQAANLVVPRHPRAKFVIVGDLYHPGKSNLAYRDGLLKSIIYFNLIEHVIFTGFRGDINVFMNEIDLLVQPSEHEALGTSMVEAMSCGKPVIGTDVDGIPEVIGKNEGGILLNPRTPEAFAEAINFFIENPHEASKRGMQGRARVLRLFNAVENVKRIQNIYEHSLKRQW